MAQLSKAAGQLKSMAQQTSSAMSSFVDGALEAVGFLDHPIAVLKAVDWEKRGDTGIMVGDSVLWKSCIGGSKGLFEWIARCGRSCGLGPLVLQRRPRERCLQRWWRTLRRSWKVWRLKQGLSCSRLVPWTPASGGIDVKWGQARRLKVYIYRG